MHFDSHALGRAGIRSSSGWRSYRHRSKVGDMETLGVVGERGEPRGSAWHTELTLTWGAV